MCYNMGPNICWIVTSNLFDISFWDSRSVKWHERENLPPVYKDILFRYIPDKIKTLNLTLSQRASKAINSSQKTEFINRILKEYNKMKEVDKLLQKQEENAIVKSKFNGQIVSTITGLKGAELGKFIVQLKTFNPETLRSTTWILNAKQEEINNIITTSILSSTT